MPLILCISAFAALVSMGGAPRASILLGKGEKDQAEQVLGNCTTMLVITALVLTVVVQVFGPDLLLFFGASQATLPYAWDYTRIYAMGTLFVQLALGLNAFINAQALPGQGCSPWPWGRGATLCWTHLHLRPGHGGAGGCPGHGAVPRGLLPVDPVLPPGKADHPPPAAADAAAAAEDPPPLPGSGGVPLYHAVHGEHPQRLLQHQPPPVRWGPGGGGHDHPCQRHAVCHAPPPGVHPGGPAIVGFNYGAATGTG